MQGLRGPSRCQSAPDLAPFNGCKCPAPPPVKAHLRRPAIRAVIPAIWVGWCVGKKMNNTCLPVSTGESGQPGATPRVTGRQAERRSRFQLQNLGWLPDPATRKASRPEARVRPTPDSAPVRSTRYLQEVPLRTRCIRSLATIGSSVVMARGSRMSGRYSMRQVRLARSHSYLDARARVGGARRAPSRHTDSQPDSGEWQRGRPPRETTQRASMMPRCSSQQASPC